MDQIAGSALSAFDGLIDLKSLASCKAFLFAESRNPMTTALVIIDLQNAILSGMAGPERQREIDAALDATVARVADVRKRARKAGVPVIIVQHDDGPGHRLQIGTEGHRLRREIEPEDGDVAVHKTACDAFYRTELHDILTARNIDHLVIGGCMTQFCIDTSVRRAVSLGYDVTLLSDGHTTADMGALTFEQIITHHNALLSGFDAGKKRVTLKACAEAAF
jgi:nicotinamidase-related amidase